MIEKMPEISYARLISERRYLKEREILVYIDFISSMIKWKIYAGALRHQVSEECNRSGYRSRDKEE